MTAVVSEYAIDLRIAISFGFNLGRKGQQNIAQKRGWNEGI
jgi:hypothetical protein